MVDCFSAKFRAILGDPGNLRGQRRKSVSEPCCHRPRPFHPHPLCGNGAARVRPGLWPRLRSCDYNLSSAEPDRESGETRPPRRSIRLLGPLSAPWSPAGRVHCTSECLSLPAQLRGACGGPTSSVFQLGGLRRGAFRWRGLGLWGIPLAWPWVVGWSSGHSVKCIRWDEMRAGGTNPRASSVPHVYISRCGARMRVPVRR